MLSWLFWTVAVTVREPAANYGKTRKVYILAEFSLKRQEPVRGVLLHLVDPIKPQNMYKNGRHRPKGYTDTGHQISKYTEISRANRFTPSNFRTPWDIDEIFGKVRRDIHYKWYAKFRWDSSNCVQVTFRQSWLSSRVPFSARSQVGSI